MNGGLYHSQESKANQEVALMGTEQSGPQGRSEAPVVTGVLAGTADTAVTTEDRETHSGHPIHPKCPTPVRRGIMPGTELSLHSAVAYSTMSV